MASPPVNSEILFSRMIFNLNAYASIFFNAMDYINTVLELHSCIDFKKGHEVMLGSAKSPLNEDNETIHFLNI